MKYYVVEGTGPGAKIVKGPMSKSQAESFANKENEKFFQKALKIRSSQHNAGTPKRDKHTLYKVVSDSLPIDEKN